MYFKRLEIDNIGSLGEGNVIELDNQGIVLIQGFNELTGGSNGAGKSWIHHALVWCLTGKTGEGLSADKVINRYTPHKKNACVKVYIDDYEIIRARKHHIYKNDLIVRKNGENISLGSVRETTKFLQKIFCITYETLVNSIILGASVDVNFLASSNNSDRRKIFENILGVDKYPKYVEQLRKEKRDFENELLTYKMQIEAKQKTIESYNKKILDFKEKADEFEQQRIISLKKYQEDLEKLLSIDVEAELLKIKKYNEIEIYNHECRRKRAEFELEKSKILNNLSYNEIDFKIEQLQNKLDDYKKIVNESKNFEFFKKNWKKIDICDQQEKQNSDLKISLESQIKVLKNQIKEKESLISDNKRFLGQPCPTCGTILDQDKLNATVINYENQIKEIQQKIEVIQTEIIKKDKTIKKIQKLRNELLPRLTLEAIQNYEEQIKEIPDIEKQLDQALKEKELFDRKKEKLLEEFDQKEKLLPEIKENNIVLSELNEDELNTIKNQIHFLKNQIEQTKIKENPYLNINFDDEIKKLNIEIKQSNKQIQQLKEKLNYFDFWIEAFGNEGLKAVMIKDLLPFFNTRIEYYLNILYDGLIKLTFDHHLGYDLQGADYNSFSKGEKRRIDVAVTFALFDLLNLRSESSSNILILDEILDNLDEVGVEKIKIILNDINRRIGSIFCISHNPTLSQHFSNILTVRKNKNKIAAIEK